MSFTKIETAGSWLNEGRRKDQEARERAGRVKVEIQQVCVRETERRSAETQNGFDSRWWNNTGSWVLHMDGNSMACCEEWQRTMTINSHLRTILNAAIYLIFVMASVVLFTLGPRIEPIINPVIGGFEIKSTWTEDGSYFISGALLKNRGECEPRSFHMYANGGAQDSNAKIIRINFDASDNRIGNDLFTRPTGPQYWGPWEIFPPDEPVGPIFSIVVTHRCHALWELSQVIYVGLTEKIFPDVHIDQENTEWQ